MFRFYKTKMDRLYQARLIAEAEERVSKQIDSDPTFHTHYRAREQAALLGVAMVMSGHLSRARIRSIAATSNRRAFVQNSRVKEACWERFNIIGKTYLLNSLRGREGAILAPVHFGSYRTLAPFLVDL